MICALTSCPVELPQPILRAVQLPKWRFPPWKDCISDSFRMMSIETTASLRSSLKFFSDFKVSTHFKLHQVTPKQKGGDASKLVISIVKFQIRSNKFICLQSSSSPLFKGLSQVRQFTMILFHFFVHHKSIF